jgi:hypothetical protein
MQIIKLLEEHDYDLNQIIDLSDFTEGQIAVVRSLILSAYNEGFDEGKATVMNDLDEFLRIKNE